MVRAIYVGATSRRDKLHELKPGLPWPSLGVDRERTSVRHRSIAEREGREGVPGDDGHVLLAGHLVGHRAVGDLPPETRLPE